MNRIVCHPVGPTLTALPMWHVKLDTERDGNGGYLFELSVVRIGCHGDQSWGWAGDDKIVLLEGYAGRGGEYSTKTVKLVRKYADLLCEQLNNDGVRVP